MLATALERKNCQGQKIEITDLFGAALARTPTGRETRDWAAAGYRANWEMALHAVLCAIGYNLRWLMRAVLRLELKGILLRLVLLQLITASAQNNHILAKLACIQSHRHG